MYASTLTHAAGVALVAAILALTSGLAGVKLPASTEEQKVQAGLAKVKAAWSDKVAAPQTYKAQDRAAASYQADGRATHTQPGASCVDLRSFVVPVPAVSAPVPAARG